MSEPFHPFDYQIPMLDYGYGRDRMCYFVSPGMGKSAVTLALLDRWFTDGQSKGALIIAPLRVVLLTWPDQIARWDHSAWMRVVSLRTPEGLEAWDKGTADIYLINPEMLPDKLVKGKKRPGLATRLFKGRKDIPVDTLVIDELSLAKNPSSKRFGAIRPYIDQFPRRIGLTGTPVPNDYQDLFAQIRLIDDGERLGRSFHHYRGTHFESDYMGFSWSIRKGSKKVIDEKLSDLCLVMLGDDWLDLPSCATVDIDVPLTPATRKIYRKMEKELLLQLEKGDVIALNAATLVGKLLQITSGATYGEDRIIHHIHDAKIQALKKLRKKHGTEPMLVLTAFQHETERVLAAVPGSRRFHERDMAEWQAGRIQTWVANCAQLSHGIDGIQKSCRIAVWMSLTYSNEKFMQTNARLVRTGQSNETLIYRLLSADTVDDAVVEALRAKTDEQSGLMTALKNIQRLHK